jgi:transcriptional regulator with XRE-family HTH domain
MDTSIAQMAPPDGRARLVKYLDGKKQADFAREVQCSESHLSLILRGERGMSFALAKRISAASGIPIKDLPHEASE